MTNLEIERAYVGNTQVEKIYLGADVIYPTGPTPVLNHELCFDILSAGTIQFTKNNNSSPTVALEYSMDGVNWISFYSDIRSYTFNVSAGDKVYFRGDNESMGIYSNSNYTNTFSGSTAHFNVEGYLMSIIDSTDFETAEPVSGKNTFAHLFRGTNIHDASKLIIPGAVGANFYSRFMSQCTYLTTSPVIPSTWWTGGTPGGDFTYYNMFYGCTNLSTITALFDPSTAVGYSGLENWVSGVAASGTFYKDPNMTGWYTGNSGVPAGWTVLDYNV